MTEIRKYNSDSDRVPTFSAVEFHFSDSTLDELSSGLGRLGIFNALVGHQITENIDPNMQVWSGINAESLVKRRSLFSELNPSADPVRLNKNFNATQLSHWRSVIGEVKYSPFTYLYKAYVSGRNMYPALVGFDLSKLEPTSFDDEHIDWHPAPGQTTESALKSVYYFTSLFPASK